MSDPLGLFSQADNDPLKLFSQSNSPDEWDAPYQKYVKDYNDYNNRVEIPGTPKRDQGPLLSKEDWRSRQDSKILKNTIGAVVGTGEQAVNLLGGMGGMIVAPVVAGANAIGNALQGNPTNFENDYNALLQAAGTAGTSLVNGIGDLTGVDVNSDSRNAIANRVGNVVNDVLTPISGLHFPHVGDVPSYRPTKKVVVQPNNILENLKKQAEVPKTDVAPIPTEAQMELPLATHPQGVAEMQGMGKLQPDLFASDQANFNMGGRNAPEAIPEPIYSAKQTHDWLVPRQQDSIVEDFGSVDPRETMPNMRIDEPRYGVARDSTGQMRVVEEPGMPIRADLSMEAQNLENPLQRNLWGDELPIETGDHGIPMTQALDSMEKGPQRDLAISQLTGQRGAIDTKIFEPDYYREKDGTNGIKLVFKGGNEPTVYAMKDGTIISHAKFARDNIFIPTNSKQNLEPMWVHTVPEYQKQGIAKQMYEFVNSLGNDIQASDIQSSYGKKLWESLEREGKVRTEKTLIGNTKRLYQRGGLNLDDISKEARKFHDKFSAFGTKLSDALTPKERIILNNIGDTSYIPKGDTPETIINNAKGQPDVKLNTLMQSGLGGAALKSQSAIHLGVNRWLGWANKTAEKNVRDYVKPIEAKYGRLTPTELEAAHGILKMEMFDRKQISPEAMKQAGMSPKGIEAYQALRAGFEDVFNRTNVSRARLGLDPITKQSAYYSSNWMGNWHMPVYDKKGNIVGYVKTETRSEAIKATEWIKKNMPDVDQSKLVVKYKPENIGSRLPRDVSSTFETMMTIFKDTPMEQQMKEMLDQYRTEQAFNERGHSTHFLEKSNTRFFIGDRPWLSDRENAIAGMKSQVQYLKDAYRWAPLQEAMANIKEVLSDPSLVAEQPNNINLAKLYTANAMGISASLTKGLEQAAAEILGSSPGRMGKYIGDLKNLTYLQQLGLSTGYAIATPTQALLLGPSRHLMLTKQGFKYNMLKTMVNSTYDAIAILLAHEGYNVTGKDNLRNSLLSDTGKQALRYMEDNGIINISMFDEHANLGEHKIWNTAKNTIGVTISLPEKAARSMTFMSFVHHLKDGGMPVGLDMFRKAEEMTNATLTEFHKNARPLLIDKAGMLGELAYTYKSPLFNYYNSLFEFAKYAKQSGDYKPFITAILMTGVLGGVMNLPGVQEIDGVINFFKGLIAKYKPDWYPKISNFGVKEFALSHLPDVATYGLVSKVTGAQMASRFSNQVIDPENPLANVAPVAQELKEQGALLKNLPIVGNPNETNLQQGIWMNSPPMIKGLMETHLDNYKGAKREDGTQTYYNPNQLENRQAYVNRTPSDETYRKLGLTSLSEARQRDVRYVNKEESDRLETARDSSITKMFDAVIRKKPEDVQRYAKAYFENNGNDTEFQSKLATKINASAMTPEERQVIYANTIAEYMNIKRRLQMEQK